MLVLSTGRLLKASLVSLPSSLPSFKTYKTLSSGPSDILSATCQVLIDWNHQKIPFFSEPPALHAAHEPFTVPGSDGQVARDAEMTGHAQIVSAFGASFVLGGLFGEADAVAMDAKQDSGLAVDNVGPMDVENDVVPGFTEG